MSKTKIEWAERTWNPITGCTKISAGCKNCYAERMSKRLAGRYGYDKDNPFKVTFHPNRLGEPLKWRKPQVVFVCSMGDIFHEDVSDEWILKIFDVIRMCSPGVGDYPEHTFLILTKRPERMRDIMLRMRFDNSVPRMYLEEKEDMFTSYPIGRYLKNVWLGVTAENKKTADKRIPILLQTPAAKRFVSVEPMLGAVDLTQTPTDSNAITLNALTGIPYDWDYEQWIPEDDIGSKLDWVICGGETGPGARPLNSSWARSLRDQCIGAGVPFFFKQQGEWGYKPYGNRKGMNPYESAKVDGDLIFKCGRKLAGRKLDGQEWNERPEVEN